MKCIDNCPACGFTNQQGFDICPKCGIIIEKYFAKHLELQRIEAEKERKTPVEQATVTEDNKAITDKANRRSYFFFLIVGYLVSWVWYKFWDGLRSWGDGATIAPIGGKEFIYMILPLILCVGATILFLLRLKKTKNITECNQHFDDQVARDLVKEIDPKLHTSGVDYRTKVIIGVIIPYVLFIVFHIMLINSVSGKGDLGFAGMMLFYCSFVYIPVLVLCNYLIMIPAWRHISIVKIFGLVLPVIAAFTEYWYIYG
jgi:hypothetical protein